MQIALCFLLLLSFYKCDSPRSLIASLTYFGLSSSSLPVSSLDCLLDFEVHHQECLLGVRDLRSQDSVSIWNLKIRVREGEREEGKQKTYAFQMKEWT